MINIILFLTFILFSFGQLARLSFFEGRINFYLYEILLLLILFYLLVKERIAALKQSFAQLKFFYLFFIILFFSNLINFFNFSLWQNLITFLYLIRLVIYFLSAVYLSYWIKKNHPLKITIFSGIVFLAITTLIFSFTQYFFYPNLRNLYYLGWDEHLYRMFGVFFDTSIAAAIFGLFFLFFYQRKTIVNDKIRLALLFLYCLALILTFSRSAYLAFLITLTFYLLGKKKIKIIFYLFLFFIFVLIITPKPFGEGVNLARKFSIEARLNDYKSAFEIVKKYPIMGIGYNRIGFFKTNNFSQFDHAAFSFSSSFLIVLVTGGFLGLIFFVLGLIYLWQMKKRSRLLISYIYLLSFFDNVLLHPFVIFLLIFFLIVDR